MDTWLGNNDKKLRAKDRRILITHWVGEAWEKLKSPKYDASRWKCLERTGCLLTADGSVDDKVKPEGMSAYVVPPPLPIPAADDPFESLVPAADPIPDDTMITDDVLADTDIVEEGSTSVTPNDDLEFDEEKDRDYEHSLVGCRIRAFYDDQGDWFKGEITWFNKKMDKLRIYFEIR